MNEIDLLKRVREDVPAPDPLTLARTRQRLLTPPPARPRAIRPRLVLAGALTLAGGFLAADVISHDSTPIAGTVADAGTVLSDAAAAAIANPDAPIPPGQYRQVTTQVSQLYEFGPKKKFRATTYLQVDDWVTADPTFRIHPQRVQELVRVDFATPEAKAAARSLAPALFAHPKPRLYQVTCHGVTVERNASPDALKQPCTPSWQLPTAGFLARLPRNPDELLAKLRNDPLLGRPPTTDLERARVRATPVDQKAFSRIATVLDSGIAPADLRAALYQAARNIPGIQLIDDVVTLDGGHGRAIGYAYNGQRQDIIISPVNGQRIGSRWVVTQEGADLDKANQTGATRAGDIYSSTSVTTQITPSAPRVK